MKNLIEKQLTHIGKGYMIKREGKWAKWLTWIAVICVIGLMVLYLSSCHVRTYPGYVKYEKMKKDRVECPGDQLKAQKQKKLNRYKLFH